MAKYVAIKDGVFWKKDEVYDIEPMFNDDEMDIWEINYNVFDFAKDGVHVGYFNEENFIGFLTKGFKLLSEFRNERIDDILE